MPEDGVVVGPVGTQFLQGHLAVEPRVAGEPDLPDPSLGVQAGEGVAVSDLGGTADRREILDGAGDGSRAREVNKTLADVIGFDLGLDVY